MLGVGLGIGRQGTAPAGWWLPDYAGAVRAADYVNGRYMSQGVPVGVSALVTEARNTPQTVMKLDGTLATVAALQLALGTGTGLQIWKGATNLCLQSQTLDNATWSKAGVGTGIAPVVTANAAIAPDGTMTADQVDFDRGPGNAVGDFSTIFQGALPTTAANYTGSLWFQAVNPADVGKEIAYRHVIGGSFGTPVTLTADWVEYGKTELSPGGSRSFDLSNRGTITADNQVSAYIWGVQAEAGSVRTPYIPTTVAAMTRDEGSPTAVPAGASPFPGYNQTEGTFIIEYQQQALESVQRILTLHDGTSANRMTVYDYASNGKQQAFVTNAISGDGAQLDGTTSRAVGKIIRCALAYKLNDVAFVTDGGAVAKDLSATPPLVTAVALGGNGYAAGDNLNGYIRSETYFPTRLPDAQLQALTA